MTRTLVQHHRLPSGAAGAPPVRTDLSERARDWAEIQERMLVPLYEAVYERLEVHGGTRLLGLGCGSGLALLLAAARGARVTGVDSDQERLALARERLRAPGERAMDGGDAPVATGTLLPVDRMAEATAGSGRPRYDLITAFQPIGHAADGVRGLGPALGSAIPLARRGAPVVLAGWGPPERCATDAVLRIAGRLTDRLRKGGWRPAHRDDLEDVAARAGLEPDGSGRVSCPFGYADTESAVRGLLSTGVFDGAIRATDRRQVEKEIAEALHPHVRRDGTVWMPNVFRYLIARTP
ncbi:methyltransferase domain-containing protein [Streptomyces sp. AK02-01A]|uniref:methyltransferase domain-containing protein n=1 Tax=Streptomyces sp. AK02-01A TaxID=3028648 RepID=UPI0029A1E56C|nr:methyltransferase domain-containing protein [Streptomyces sp. AK02-01A]MDX3854422.1 methyltransferase domain-containing protein [Streptomyces sp. AK02-01A]